MDVVLLYKDNSNWLHEFALLDESNAVFLNAAAVTATLYDSGSAIVTGVDHLAMVYQAGSDGHYSVLIPGSFSPALSPDPKKKFKDWSTWNDYKLTIHAVQGAAVMDQSYPVLVVAG